METPTIQYAKIIYKSFGKMSSKWLSIGQFREIQTVTRVDGGVITTPKQKYQWEHVNSPKVLSHG